METIYRSFDEVDFTNREDCIKHERKILQMIPKLISQAREICDLNEDCSDCIFYNTEGHCCSLHPLPSFWFTKEWTEQD